MACCKYTAGMLKEPITFERKTLTADGAGGWTTSWATITGAPEWAMVRPMSGSERWQSARVEATSSHKIVVRYSALLTEADRAVIRGVTYNIRFLNNVDFEDRWLEITANAGVPT